MTAKPEPRVEVSTPLFVADDMALDFINTAYGMGEARQECLASGAQVLAWLRLAGLTESFPVANGRLGALHKAALALRETALDLVMTRKAGGVGDVTPLNRVLELDSSYREIAWSKGRRPKVEQRRRIGRIEALLVPVAEALATLLAQGDFTLVRKCEGSDCILWFYDHTKSHRRRWCSMALCGNRTKVAAFRARRNAS
jgi:predicted RNA-binding Zn ribbon-like protein